MISPRDLYTALVQIVGNEESISWNRLYNFLMANSILVLAWATLYPSTAPSVMTRVVLTAICLLGGFSGLVWSELGTRTRLHLEAHFDQARRLEGDGNSWEQGVDDSLKPFTRSEPIRQAAKWYSTNPFVLKWIPLLFTALYLVLLTASWIA